MVTGEQGTSTRERGTAGRHVGTETLLLAGAGGVGVLSVLSATLGRWLDDSGDAAIYLAMARSPGTLFEAPWGFRVGVPWFAGLLPVEERTGLLILNVAGAVALAALMAVFVSGEARRGSWPVRPVGVLGFSLVCSSASVYMGIRSGLVDLPTLAVMMATLVAAQRNRWWAIVPLLALAVSMKEASAMVLLPLGLVAVANGWRSRPLRAVLAAAVAAVAVYVVIRSTSLVFDVRPGGAGLPAVGEILDDQAQRLGSWPRALANAAYTSVGVLAPVALIGLVRARGWTLAVATLALPIGLTLLIASDWPRLLAFGVLVLVPLVAVAGHHTGGTVFTIVVANFAHVWVAPRVPAVPRVAVVLGALVAATVAGVIAARRAGHPSEGRWQSMRVPDAPTGVADP